MTYSSHFRERTSATSGEAPVYLLEISHAQLAVPVRVVNDTQDLVSNGDTYIALAFRVNLPDDVERALPRARLSVDNVGRELVQWLDASAGGKGSKVRIMQVMRDTPDVVEADYTLDLLNVKQNAVEVSGELGYEDTLNAPAILASYRPDNAPGIF